jgi:caa(3)-type oxidase subunit IV
MAEGHPPEADRAGRDDHAGATTAAYLIVFCALAVFTLVSFVANWLASDNVHVIDKVTSFVIILAVAVVKAVLVALIFMHLKFDWRKLYFVIVPVMILAAMMLIVFLPDMVLAWHH